MAFSAKAISNLLLDLARNRQIELSPMKLQKLIYFAHGWYLALADQPLIDEPVEAWQYGPVVESVYHEFKQFGNQPIAGYAKEMNGLEYVAPYVDEFSRPNISSFLNQILDLYGGYSAIQLSNMTHEPNSPWDTKWRETEGAYRHVDIPNELISQYFKAKIPAQQ